MDSIPQISPDPKDFTSIRMGSTNEMISHKINAYKTIEFKVMNQGLK